MAMKDDLQFSFRRLLGGGEERLLLQGLSRRRSFVFSRSSSLIHLSTYFLPAFFPVFYLIPFFPR